LAYIDISATKGSNISGPGHWDGLNNVGSTDNAYTTLVSGVTLWPVYLYQFSPSLPADVEITGIELTLQSFATTGSGTPVFSVYMVGDTALTPISAIKTTSALASSVSGMVLGSSTDLWSSDLKRYQVDKQYFGLVVTPSGSNNSSYNIDSATLRIYYSAPGYLVGSRSQFTRRTNTLFDVMTPAHPGAVYDNIKLKANGTSIAHQVKADDVNKLGDALYNIEKVAFNIASLTNPVFTGGSDQKMYATTITITGTVSAPLTGYISYQKLLNPSAQPSYTTGSSSVGLTNTGRTNLIVPPSGKNINFLHISAIAYVTAGPTVTPLYIQPNFSFTSNNYPASGYNLSFLASAKNPILSTTSDFFSDPLPSYDRYVQVNSLGTIPAGTLTVKIFALGRENF
jgi:hypothetical protein